MSCDTDSRVRVSACERARASGGGSAGASDTGEESDVPAQPLPSLHRISKSVSCDTESRVRFHTEAGLIAGQTFLNAALHFGGLGFMVHLASPHLARASQVSSWPISCCRALMIFSARSRSLDLFHISVLRAPCRSPLDDGDKHREILIGVFTWYWAHGVPWPVSLVNKGTQAGRKIDLQRSAALCTSRRI